MKKIYLLAWILLAATVLGAWEHGNINPQTILVFSFLTFALAYGFALWLAFTNDPAAHHQAEKINI